MRLTITPARCARGIEQMLHELDRRPRLPHRDPLLCRRAVLGACREPLAAIAVLLRDLDGVPATELAAPAIALVHDGASPLYGRDPGAARDAAERVLADLVGRAGTPAPAAPPARVQPFRAAPAW